MTLSTKNKCRCSRLIFILLLHISVSLNAFSQDKNDPQFGKVTVADFELPKSKYIDANTSAVVVANVARTNFVGNKDNNWVSYVYKKFTRIKIINKKAFDLATIIINLYGSNKRQDQLLDLHASTYTLENGTVVETKLNPDNIYKDSLNKGHVQKKFAFPALKEGAIIEYSYSITSFRYSHLPAWSFQYISYPCLYSEYQVEIPNMLGYLTTYHGSDSFYVDKLEKTREMYKMSSINVTTEVKKHTWVMKDIPPFTEEDYLYNSSDYRDGIEFQLAQTYTGEVVNNFADSWQTLNTELLGDNEFGGAIDPERNTNLQNQVEKITSRDSNLLQYAQNIYYYIRDNFISTKDEEIYPTNNMYTVNKKHAGNVADINLLLTSMLRQKGINANPVILSTREFGVNSSKYPNIEKMNYVVCMVKLWGDSIFLDATEPKLKFGTLHLDCYNGHARVISEKDSGSLYFNPDKIHEQHSTTVFITSENGKLNGSYQRNTGLYESEYIRQQVKTSGIKGYFDKMKSIHSGETTVTNIAIDSLNKPDFPIAIRYDFSLSVSDNADIFYFDPILNARYRENPFKSGSRRLPVQMPYPVDELYVLNMEIPAGYIVDELPKSVKVAFNENEGFFEYLIQKDQSNIQLRCHLKFAKANFLPEDYNSLRDFFGFVVNKQSEQIVFKKKK